MTLSTPEAQIALNEDHMGSLMQVIADLRKLIEIQKQEASTGGKLDSTIATKTLAELNKVVLACTVTETKLDDCRNKQAGIARGGYALDLEQARADIGCKLDRLRACCGSGSVLE